MGKNVLFLGILFGTTLLTACGLLDLQGASPDECNPAGSLLQDDFSGEQNCGWVEYNRGGAMASIENGVLRMSSSQPGEIWWTNPGRNFDDVIIEVDAEQVGGPDNNAYGVICRYQNEENFYVFLISGDGFYVIGKYQSGSDEVIYLTEDGQYVESPAINQGEALNRLRVSCIGNELSLAVNGVPLLTVTDPTFVTGDIGLSVSTFELGSAVVEFDNLRVVAP